MNQQVSFKLPTVINKKDGAPRKVGFELEFSGLTLEQTVEALQSSLGGRCQEETPAEQIVRVESLGDFTVELDWNYLKHKAAESGQGEGRNDWLELLGKVASLLVPVEVVCPPIPITNLNALDPMVSALRKAGATGTEESMIAAYGVHINAEIFQLDPEVLFSYVRAFCVLQWWLVEKHEVNTTRKISPYIDLYPDKYVKHVLSSAENPGIAMICNDYLEYNPTRNRALDMLPLLAEIDAERVSRAVDDPRIKARPTFHYRLPNCNIEHPGWSLAESWNKWWIIEQLAQRPDDLRELSAAFLDAEQPIIGVSRKQWVGFIDKWLKKNELG
jgi:hypothetical protein